MKLYLIRHAQSTANVARLLNTALPGPPLTDLGRQQADALAAQLCGEPIAAVYASHATRARQTAEPLAAALSMDVRLLDGIQEIFVGDLEDRADPEAVQTYADVVREWTRGDTTVSMPGGESGDDVRRRYLGAIDLVRAKHADADSDGVVVVVSHGGAIRVAAEWLCDNVSAEMAGQGLIPNTGVVRLDARPDGRWHCLEWAGMSLGS